MSATRAGLRGSPGPLERKTPFTPSFKTSAKLIDPGYTLTENPRGIMKKAENICFNSRNPWPLSMACLLSDLRNCIHNRLKLWCKIQSVHRRMAFNLSAAPSVEKNIPPFRAPLSRMWRSEFSCVDSFYCRNSVFFEIVAERRRWSEIGMAFRVFFYSETCYLNLWWFDILRINSVVSDHRVCHCYNLTAIWGICENFLITAPSEVLKTTSPRFSPS